MHILLFMDLMKFRLTKRNDYLEEFMLGYNFLDNLLFQS